MIGFYKTVGADLMQDTVVNVEAAYRAGLPAWSKCWLPLLVVPQLGSCTSSGRAWRLWAARHSQREAQLAGLASADKVLLPPWQ